MSLPNTFFGTAGVRALLKGRKKLWFIGIGGVHMRSLALFCRARGFEVEGSDTSAHAGVRALREAGVHVHVGHHPACMAEFDAVVYTLAISAEDPEYQAAVGLGLPVLSRADLLGYLSADHPRRICVAGSHGKSTVTAMLGEIFAAAGRAPTVTEDLESEVWASLTYQDGNDIKELPLEFDVICSHFLGKIHDYDMVSMTEECTKSLLKNLTRLQAKLAALQEKAQSIRTGALKVKETDLQEFARRNESLMADYEEYAKTLSEIAAEAKKNSRAKTAIAIGVAVAVVVILIITFINMI